MVDLAFKVGPNKFITRKTLKILRDYLYLRSLDSLHKLSPTETTQLIDKRLIYKNNICKLTKLGEKLSKHLNDIIDLILDLNINEPDST